MAGTKTRKGKEGTEAPNRGEEVAQDRLTIFHAGPVAFDRPLEFQVYRIEADEIAKPGVTDYEHDNFISDSNDFSACTTCIEGFHNLIEGTEASAVICLGYPDQLPMLKHVERITKKGAQKSTYIQAKKEQYNNEQAEEDLFLDIPLFWWAQLSKPFGGFSLSSSVTSVPLTPINGDLLASAGVRNIGPVIPHGVDSNVFKPAEKGKALNFSMLSNPPSPFVVQSPFVPFVVGAVGANNRRKRFDDLFESFSLFVRKLENGPGLIKKQPSLLIKTDKRRSLSGWDLEALAKRWGIASHTKILDGETSPRDMAEIYNNMDVFLSVSEWEGFCIPVIEAMACGVPVIARKGQGPGELVPNEALLLKSECLYDQQPQEILGKLDTTEEFIPTRVDPEEAAELLYRLAKNDDLRIRSAQQGRSIAIEHFSITKVAESWRDLIFFR